MVIGLKVHGSPSLAACYRSTGDTDELVAGRFGEFGFPPPALALSGDTVAYGVDVRSNDDTADFRTTYLEVVQHAPDSSGSQDRWHFLHTEQAGTSRESKMGSVVVRRSGAVAWISCPMSGHARNSSEPTCVRPGRTDAVFRISTAGLGAPHARELLARGRDIDPRSLRRKGDRIYWTKDGRRKSALLQ